MNGGRPEMLYKICKNDALEFKHPKTGKLWCIFRYYGKRKNLKANHVLSSSIYKKYFMKYMEKREKIIKKFFPYREDLNNERSPLFFNHEGRRFSKNINELAKPVLRDEALFNMDSEQATIYSWRRSAANVGTYLDIKGVKTEDIEDYTISLRNHSKEVSDSFYNS